MQRKTNLVLRIAAGCIFVFLFVSVINLQVQMNELRAERDARLERIQHLQDDVDELELRIAEPIDDEFIERIAREELGYCMPNEIIFYNNIAE